MKNSWLFVVVALLAGCSSGTGVMDINNPFRTWDSQFADQEKITEKLRSPQAQPTSLDSLQFQLAPLETKIQVDITESSPVITFPQGKSYVAPLVMPATLNQFTFELESLIGRTVFVPHVLFLDENLQEVTQIHQLEVITDGYIRIKKVFTKELAPRIRYIVVYTDNQALNNRTELPNEPKPYDIALGKEPEDMKKFYAKNSALGNLNIRLSNVYFAASNAQPQAKVKTKTQVPVTEPVVKQQSTAKVEVSKPVQVMAVAPVAVEVDAFSEADSAASMTSVEVIVEEPSILPDTEAFYLKQISIAVKEDNLSRAWDLVEEAQRAGSTKAKAHYKKEIKNSN